MNQVQVWQLLYRHFTALCLGAITRYDTAVKTAPCKSTSLKLSYLLYRRLEGSWSLAEPESRAERCVVAMGKCRSCARFKNTFSISSWTGYFHTYRRLPVQEEAWGRGQSLTGTPAGGTLWSPTVLKSGMIFPTSRRDYHHPRVFSAFL